MIAVRIPGGASQLTSPQWTGHWPMICFALAEEGWSCGPVADRRRSHEASTGVDLRGGRGLRRLSRGFLAGPLDLARVASHVPARSVRDRADWLRSGDDDR